MPLKLLEKDGAVMLGIKVVPNSSRPQIVGILGDALKIKVPQPPEDGKANRAVEALLAQALGLPPSNVTVASGHSRAQKNLRILGLPLAIIQQKLAALTS